MISTYMHRITLPPGEIVHYCGEITKNMYIIRQGYCHMWSPENNSPKELGPGDSFCVLEMILNASACNTIITITCCQLLVLNRKQLTLALHHFPQFSQEMEVLAKTEIDSNVLYKISSQPLDIEATVVKPKSFKRFKYILKKGTFEYEDFYAPFRKVGNIEIVY